MRRSTASTIALLLRLQLLLQPLSASDEMKRTPRQHARDWIEVRSVDITADPRGLERNRAGSAKGVRHFRPVAETHDTQLLDQFGHRLSRSSEMVIHVRPNSVISDFGKLFRSQARDTLST